MCRARYAVTLQNDVTIGEPRDGSDFQGYGTTADGLSGDGHDVFIRPSNYELIVSWIIGKVHLETAIHDRAANAVAGGDRSDRAAVVIADANGASFSNSAII